MKIKLLLFFTLITSLGYSQDYLVKDETKVIFTEFGDGIPTNIKNSFSNFDVNPDLGSDIEGLIEKPYIVTSADESTIDIELENIGRVVLYAKLFNKNDSILFNPLSNRKGEITIIPFRDNKEINSIISKTSFDEDIFQQIHFNFRKSGIDKIKIKLYSDNDRFILEKLKIVPLNSDGINYYKELEKSESSILDLTNHLEDNASILKTKYENQINQIQDYHKNLTTLIDGNKFESVANKKVNSLNPFKNGEFIKHYETILEKASTAEKAKIDNLTKGLENSDFKNIAITLDNLFTGGKFASLINLIDGIFDKSISLPQEEFPILHINDTYFNQDKLNRGKIKLVPITDSQTIDKIENLTKENKAFKTYISKIINFTKEDLETMNELNKDILVAKIIRADLEELTWEIISDYTSLKKDELINKSDVNFFLIGKELTDNFKTEDIELGTFQNARSKSIVSINKFNNLSAKYNKVASKIKTHYDFLYENRPNERKNAFDDLASILPPNLVIDWNNGQSEITTEYLKIDGLKSFLSEATGKE